MKDWNTLAAIINEQLTYYKERFNEVNPTDEIDFTLTFTNHKVDVGQVKKDVAYCRLEKRTRPKGGTDQEWESMLVYNQAYKFDNIQERLDPKTPWKYDIYEDMLGRLIAGGLEYAELLKRTQALSKANAGKPLSNIVAPEEPNIIITDQMPAPLTDDEKKYKEWVEKNKQN